MSVEVHQSGVAPVRPEFEVEPSEAVTIGDVERPLPLTERIVNNESFQRLAVLVVLIVVWELYARWLHNSLLFPTFTETVQTFWRDLMSGVLVNRTATSLRTLALGYAADESRGVTERERAQRCSPPSLWRAPAATGRSPAAG